MQAASCNCKRILAQQCLVILHHRVVHALHHSHQQQHQHTGAHPRIANILNASPYWPTKHNCQRGEQQRQGRQQRCQTIKNGDARLHLLQPLHIEQLNVESQTCICNVAKEYRAVANQRIDQQPHVLGEVDNASNIGLIRLLIQQHCLHCLVRLPVHLAPQHRHLFRAHHACCSLTHHNGKRLIDGLGQHRKLLGQHTVQPLFNVCNIHYGFSDLVDNLALDGRILDHRRNRLHVRVGVQDLVSRPHGHNRSRKQHPAQCRHTNSHPGADFPCNYRISRHFPIINAFRSSPSVYRHERYRPRQTEDVLVHALQQT